MGRVQLRLLRRNLRRKALRSCKAQDSQCRKFYERRVSRRHDRLEYDKVGRSGVVSFGADTSRTAAQGSVVPRGLVKPEQKNRASRRASDAPDRHGGGSARRGRCGATWLRRVKATRFERRVAGRHDGLKDDIFGRCGALSFWRVNSTRQKIDTIFFDLERDEETRKRRACTILPNGLTTEGTQRLVLVGQPPAVSERCHFFYVKWTL